MEPRAIVIIGNGITGVTAARHIRKRSDSPICIVSAETEFPYSRPALMYVFMGDLTFERTKLYEDDFWEKNRIELKHGRVRRIDTASKQLEMEGGEPIPYDTLVVATGSSSNKFGWPGQNLRGVQGLYSFQDLELMEKHTPHARRAVIVGGGLIGVEVAEMLNTRRIPITFLIRETNFWDIVLPEGEARMINREIQRHGVDMRLETELDSILPDDTGGVRAVKTKDGEEIECDMVFLTVGVHPNKQLVEQSGIECDKGVLVDRHFRTSAPDVYAGGDCAQHREPPEGRRPVEQVWYTGKIHGEHIGANICGDERAYEPGVWFNSAKFFDIEYQTYGLVLPNPDDGEESFYWEDPEDRRCLTIRFRSDNGAVTGCNLLGLRHRHAVWEQWIQAKTPVGEVMAHLGAANFDPEFFRKHEPSVIAAFNKAYPDRAVELRTRKGLFSGRIRELLKLEGRSKVPAFAIPREFRRLLGNAENQ